MSTRPSTPFHLILRSERGEKRPDARRVSTGIATLFQAHATTQMAAFRLAQNAISGEMGY